MAKKAKMWKVKVIGTYYFNNKNPDEREYEVEGIIPMCERGWVLSFLKAHYLTKWIHDKYKERPSLVATYDLEKVEEVEGDLKVDGMDIDTMGWDELREMATAFTLTTIPVAKKGSLKDAREKAKKAYLEEIMQIDLSEQKDVLKGMQNGKPIVDLSGKSISVRLSDMIKAPTKEERSLEATLRAVREEEDEKIKLEGTTGGATVIK
jgi:GTPase SAR1 family protein